MYTRIYVYNEIIDNCPLSRLSVNNCVKLLFNEEFTVWFYRFSIIPACLSVFPAVHRKI